MLGLLQNLLRQSGNAVLPGGLSEDGDWELMTSENWDDVGSTNWQAWNAAADS